MDLTARPRRKGPGPALTALALLCVVVGLAHAYYRMPGAFAPAAGQAAAARRAPTLAWTRTLDLTGRIALDAGPTRILAVAADGGMLAARWFDRLGFETAALDGVPEPMAWATDGASLLVVRTGPAAGGDAEVVVLYPDTLPEGQAVAGLPAADGAVLQAAGSAGVAVASYGRPAGPALAPDHLVWLRRAEDPGTPWTVAWSGGFETARILQLAAGEGGAATLEFDPNGSAPYRVAVHTSESSGIWESALADEDALLLLGVERLRGEAAVLALAGDGLLALGEGGVLWRARLEAGTPESCWAAGGDGVLCGVNGERPWYVLIGPDGHPGPAAMLEPGRRIWPLRGVGVLVGERGRLTALSSAGQTLWSVEAPMEAQEVVVAADGLAVSDGRSLSWFSWPGGEVR